MNKIALVVIVITASLLRGYGLNAKCLWVDEALSYRMAEFQIREIIWRSSVYDGLHPPLYFCLLRLWIVTFGDGELSLRLPSFVSGVLCVYFAYKLLDNDIITSVNSHINNNAFVRLKTHVFIYALLITFNPLGVLASRQVRGYTVGLALWLLSSICLLKALRQPKSRARHLIFVALFNIIQSYINYICILMVLGQFVFLSHLAWMSKRRSDVPGCSHICFKDIAYIYGIVLLAYLPWAYTLWGQFFSARQTFPGSAFTLHLTVPHETFVALFGTWARRWSSPHWVAVVLSVAFMLIVLRGATTQNLMSRYFAICTLVPMFIMIIYSFVLERNLYYSRYLLFPITAGLGSVSIWAAGLKSRVERCAVSAMIILCAVCSCGLNWRDIGPHSAPGMREASHYVNMRMCSEDVLLAAGPMEFFKMAYYFRKSKSPYIVVSDSISSLWGRHYMRDEEILKPSTMTINSTDTIWWVTEDHLLSIEPPIDNRWQAREEAVFAQQYPWERPLKVIRLMNARRDSFDR